MCYLNTAQLRKVIRRGELGKLLETGEEKIGLSEQYCVLAINATWYNPISKASELDRWMIAETGTKKKTPTALIKCGEGKPGCIYLFSYSTNVSHYPEKSAFATKDAREMSLVSYKSHRFWKKFC